MSTGPTTAAAEPQVPPAPRTPPRAVPVAGLLGALLAVVVIAVGVVGVQHLAVARGWASGTSWLVDGLAAVDGLGPSLALAIGGGAAAVVGLLMLVAALKPGRRTHRSTPVDADLWISGAAVRALARERADRLPGVAGVRRVRLGRRRLRLAVTAQHDADAVQQRVDDEVGPALERVAGVRTSVRASTEVAS